MESHTGHWAKPAAAAARKAHRAHDVYLLLE